MGEVVYHNKAIIILKRTSTNNPTSLAEEPIQYYVEMLHNHIARPLKLDEPTIDHIRLIEVSQKEFDECIINLVDFNEIVITRNPRFS
jgi:hypothetical protein